MEKMDRPLTEHEETVIKDTMKGMRDDELIAAIRAIPMRELSKELQRRQELAIKVLDRVAEVVLTVNEESTYGDMMMAIKVIHTLTSLSDI